VFARLPDEVDIVFIDTSHAYLHTVQELNLYRWLVRPGGRIVLHDTELAHPMDVVGPAYPVKKAVEEFVAAEGLTWTNRPHCWGLGVIEMGEG
jgi:cephalosporin hydroxylase